MRSGAFAGSRGNRGIDEPEGSMGSWRIWVSVQSESRVSLGATNGPQRARVGCLYIHLGNLKALCLSAGTMLTLLVIGLDGVVEQYSRHMAVPRPARNCAGMLRLLRRCKDLPWRSSLKA